LKRRIERGIVGLNLGKGGPSMRRSLTLLFAAGALLLSVPAAFAAPESFTVTEKGVTESFTDVLPCVSDSAAITITYNSVFHITEFENGTYHVSGTPTVSRTPAASRSGSAKTRTP
jgi:hypothetical protein